MLTLMTFGTVKSTLRLSVTIVLTAFVVGVDNDKKFKKGDILNFHWLEHSSWLLTEGNVLDGGYAINWTGACYLKMSFTDVLLTGMMIIVLPFLTYQKTKLVQSCLYFYKHVS